MDPVLLEIYFGDYRTACFIESLADAVLCHEFGRDLVLKACARSNTTVPQTHDRETVITLISEWFRRGGQAPQIP